MSDLFHQIPIQTWEHLVTAVFLFFFCGTIVMTYIPARSREMARAERMPLEDEEQQA